MKKLLLFLSMVVIQGCTPLSTALNSPFTFSYTEFDFIKNSKKSGDLSGVTWVAPLQSYFFIVNHGQLIFETDIAFNLKRKISIPGFNDPEDIAFMEMDSSNNPLFAIIEESGTIAVGKISSNANTVHRNSFELINFANYGLFPKFWNFNKGAEGITYIPEQKAFYVVKEKWPLDILKIPYNKGQHDGKATPQSILTQKERVSLKKFAKDLSAITYVPDENALYLLSDESKCIITMDLTSGKFDKVTKLYHLKQPEGITYVNNKTIMVVSEPDQGSLIITK